MSDPVTNYEIEDVLSSIRRLVSEGDSVRTTRPADSRADRVTVDTMILKETAAAPAPEGDKLVLTAALRVPEDDTPEDDAASDDMAEDVDSPTLSIAEPDTRNGSLSARASLEATIAELEAAVTARPDEWEPDGSEAETAETPRDTGLFQLVGDQTADDHAPEETAEAKTALAEVVTKAIPDVDTETETEADAEDDTAMDDDDDGSVWTDEATVAALTDAALQTPLSDRPAAPANDATDPAPAAASAAVAFRHLAVDDRDRADTRDALTGAAPASEDETLEQFLARGGGVDEAALRQMVMEIVRQELQGKLGERITRNVRKLVRREIMRVLNAQDLD